MENSNLWEKYSSKFVIYSINTPNRIAMFMANVEYEMDNPVHMETTERFHQINNIYLRFRYSKMIRFFLGLPKSNVNNSTEFHYNNLGMLKIDEKFFRTFVYDNIKHNESELSEYNAVITSILYWYHKSLNSFADTDDIVGCTLAMSGCLIGLESRAMLYDKWLKFLKRPVEI